MTVNERITNRTTLDVKHFYCRSQESPSQSVEAVNHIPQSVDNDSDFDVEPELPPLKEVLSEEVYRKLKPKERKRQEVINGLCISTVICKTRFNLLSVV